MQIVSSTRATLQVTSAFLEMFREKIWPRPQKSKNVTKTIKIESYNTRLLLWNDLISIKIEHKY